MSLQQIEEQAFSLPPTDRELLAQRLLHSLDNAPFPILRRLGLRKQKNVTTIIITGITKGIPGEKLFDEIRQELGWQS